MNRTICIPIAEIISGGTKAEFYAALRQTMEASRSIANLSATECLRQDTAGPDDQCPKLYTYPIVSAKLPGMTSICSNICRSVEKNYRSERWDVRHGKRASRSYRSFPWPLLSNKSTETIRVRDAGEWLEADIRLSDGKWWTVRLAGGSPHRDQTRGIKSALAGSGIGDSKIWVDRKHKAIIGLSVERPPSTAIPTTTGTMSVCSTMDHLLVCTIERDSVPFAINGDDAIRWNAESSRRQQRLRQDRKSGENRKRCREAMNAIAEKMSRRFRDHIHKISSQVVSYAVRRRVAELRLDLTVKSYIKSYQWSALESAIKYKCEDQGIAVVVSTQSVEKPDLNTPHIYFKFAPSTRRIKIGKTGRDDGGRHGSETDSSEELIILAIDNQPKNKLTAKEKHYHAMFASFRVQKNKEWFHAENIIEWLRAVQWIGNAGNLSQISQFLDISQDTSRDGHLQPDSEENHVARQNDSSQNAAQVSTISDVLSAAVEMSDEFRRR